MKNILLPVLIVIALAGHSQNGLVAHYLFDGNARDTSGNANHGALSGPTPASDRFGQPNKAYFFDGVNDFITVLNSNSMNPSVGITVSAWYKTTSFVGGGYSAIANKAFTSHNAPTYQYKLGVTGSYGSSPLKFMFSVTINNIEHRVQTTSNFWTVDTWYHLAGTYDGSTLKLYVNNVVVDSKVISGNLSNYATVMKIGDNPTISDFLKGTIDDLRIYGRGISADEVTFLYEGPPPNPTGVVQSEGSPVSLNIFPNPCNGLLKINYEGIIQTNFAFTLFDLKASKLLDLNSKNSVYAGELDLRDIPEGVYILESVLDGKIFHNKVIVQN